MAQSQERVKKDKVYCDECCFISITKKKLKGHA